MFEENMEIVELIFKFILVLFAVSGSFNIIFAGKTIKNQVFPAKSFLIYNTVRFNNLFFYIAE